MPELNPDDFIDRYATCPLCQRSNVRLRYYRANTGMHIAPQPVDVVLDEHSMAVDMVAHPAPIDPGARAKLDRLFNPRATGATYARLRCPASLAPLMPMEDA